MAEIKNTFIKSKMNKDLDDRLIPKGEYRDALNIGISQTESDDVGALHVVLGNQAVKDLNKYIDTKPNVRAIGIHPDNNSQKIYVFLTNFLDTTSNSVNKTFSTGTDVESLIVEYDTVTNTFQTLVEGSFLNFSLNAPINNIDIIEDLLFWTDNRNQPRKINIKQALAFPNYYRNEDLISVAKYYPWEEIKLIQNEITDITVSFGGSGTVVKPVDFEVGQVFNTTPGLTVGGSGLVVEVTSIDVTTGNITGVGIVDPGQNYNDGDSVTIETSLSGASPILSISTARTSTMRDTCTPHLPPSGVSISTANPAIGPLTLEQVQAVDPIPLFEEISGGVYPYTVTGNGLWVYNANNPGTGWNVVETVAVNGVTGEYTVQVFDQVNLDWTTVGDTFYFAQANPYYNDAFPGDCEYLKDRFVRFAYRFKYIDNEYSLISPFTQPIFQPKQYGYFIYPQQSDAYINTEVNFAQNRITEVDLLIPCPNLLEGNQTWRDAEAYGGIESVQIIYKDDNESTLKILNEISKENFGTSQSLKFTYQSTTPFRVLPESELVRTSDVVPIRALTQSVSGNRVIYGNYLNRHSSIRSLNYRIGTRDKSIDSTLKYSNHTLKQNRTYQVGFVMADRYGRKSDVILADLDFSSFVDSSGISYGASTVYNTYGADVISSVPSTTWPGDQLSVLLQQPFPTTGPIGYPGLFKSYSTLENQITNFYAGDGSYAGGSAPQLFNCIGGSGTGMQIQAYVDPATGKFTVGAVDFATWPGTGIGLPSIVNQGSNYSNGDIITVEDPLNPGTGTANFILNLTGQPNLLGFNSFQVVVKQQEQEYYNVYLPGVVNGEINTTSSTVSNNRAVISLFSDNINKVPKDLQDVGPSQTNYNSNTELFLRVENTLSGNKQFLTTRTPQSVTQISELSDIGINLVRTSLTVNNPIGGGGDTYDFTSYDEDNIAPGSSVTVIDHSTGNVKIGLEDGVYVAAYNENTGINGSTVVLNEDISSLYTVVVDDIFIFGPSGVIFNAGNNPLIGLLSTTESIGISEDEGFKPFLSVFETKPTFSNLDIFWETSTTGLISDTNFNIINGDIVELGPTTISDIYFELNENECDDGVNTPASNYFYPLNQINDPIIDSNTICTLEGVVDGNNNPVSGFSIESSPTGEFRITSTGERYCGGDNNAYQYSFSIKIVCQGVTLLKQETGALSNEVPAITGSIIPNIAIRYRQAQNVRNQIFGGWLRKVTLQNTALNGALGSGVDNFEVTKELVSATIVSFSNGYASQTPCECLTARQVDNLNGNDSAWLSAADTGLYEGMDVSGLFMWDADSVNSSNGGYVFNNTTNPSYAQLTCYSTQRPIAPNFDSELYFLGLPSSNGPRIQQQNGVNYIRMFSTADLCDDVKIKIVLKVTDGPGVVVFEEYEITPTRVS